MLSTLLDVCWTFRLETLGACSERLSQFMNEVRVYPVLEQWFRTANSRAQALRRPLLDLSPAGLMKWHAETKQDVAETVQPLGFWFSAWNGQPDEASTGISVRCGSYMPKGYESPDALPNYLEFDFPRPHNPSIQTPETMRGVMTAAIRAYDADHCRVYTLNFLEHMEDLRQRFAFPGWITWFRGPVHPIPNLGDDATVEPFEGGALITLGERPLDDERPEDVARLRDAYLKMRAAGYPV